MEEVKTVKSYIMAAVSCLILTAADQLTKAAAAAGLKARAPFVIWKGVFALKYVENRGAAFGMMQGARMTFVFTAVVIFLLICAMYRKMPHTKRFYLLRVCAVLVCSGAVGNLIDRARMGYVIDFFYFELIDFPVFNVADCYVVVSAALFMYAILFYNTDEELKCFSFREKGK